MDRPLQIIVVFMAVTASAEAEGEKLKTPAYSADASSIILAPRPVTAVQLPTTDPGTTSRPIPPAVATGILFGMPAYGPESTSSYISSAIAAGLPKFDPLPKAIDMAAAGTKSDGMALRTTAGIALLPAFIVRDTKIPNEDQILTSGAKAKVAMNKYLGPSDGLDRGVLNRYTLRQLWEKIPILPRLLPILGGLQFVGTPVRMSNEDRAYDAGGANDTIPYPHPPPKVKDGSDD